MFNILFPNAANPFFRKVQRCRQVTRQIIAILTTYPKHKPKHVRMTIHNIVLCQEEYIGPISLQSKCHVTYTIGEQPHLLRLRETIEPF